MSRLPTTLGSLGAALAVVIGIEGSLPSARAAVPPSRNGNIAFTSTALDQDADGHTHLEANRVALVAPDGARRMISARSDAAFAPGGQVLAIAHTGGRSSRGIFLHRLDGSERARLTSGSDSDPAWSPTRQRLAFERRTCSSTGCHIGVYTIGRDGAGLRRVVRRGYSPAWSVRGTIAYGTKGEIWATGPRGKRRWRLAKRGPGDFGSNNPDWSPAGDKLVFERQWNYPGEEYPLDGLFVVTEREPGCAAYAASRAPMPRSATRSGLQTGAGSPSWLTRRASMGFTPKEGAPS